MSWNASSTGMTTSKVSTLIASDQNFAALSSYWLFCSSNGGVIWTWTGSDMAILTSFVADGTDLFAAYAQFLTSSDQENFLSRSTDNGKTWRQAGTGLDNASIRALTIIGTTLVAGSDTGVFRSTDFGTSWTAQNSGLTTRPVTALASAGTAREKRQQGDQPGDPECPITESQHTTHSLGPLGANL
jgi:hypothetical protein